MFYGILIFIHIFICLGLIIIVLIQAGRGGGLAESFSGAESIFGTKTNTFLTRTTTVFAVIFFITCLALAFLSKQRSQSIMATQKQRTLPAQKREETENLAGTEESPETQKVDSEFPLDTAEKNTQEKQPESQTEQDKKETR